MQPIPSHLLNLPIYRKSQEIASLSQRISKYFRYDLSALKQDGSEDNDIYFTGDIIQQSQSLGPEILKAEMNADRKYTHAKSVDWITLRLNRTLGRLEKSGNNGKDFIPLLRKELKHFRQLQRNWMLNL